MMTDEERLHKERGCAGGPQEHGGVARGDQDVVTHGLARTQVAKHARGQLDLDRGCAEWQRVSCYKAARVYARRNTAVRADPGDGSRRSSD